MIKPVESSIPGPLQQAISLSDKYDTYVETNIRETIKEGELENKIMEAWMGGERTVWLSQNVSSTFSKRSLQRFWVSCRAHMYGVSTTHD